MCVHAHGGGGRSAEGSLTRPAMVLERAHSRKAALQNNHQTDSQWLSEQEVVKEIGKRVQNCAVDAPELKVGFLVVSDSQRWLNKKLNITKEIERVRVLGRLVVFSKI
jgi:hypothetical protein